MGALTSWNPLGLSRLCPSNITVNKHPVTHHRTVLTLFLSIPNVRYQARLLMLLARVCTWRLINYEHSCRTTHVVVTNRRSKCSLFLPARTERSPQAAAYKSQPLSDPRLVYGSFCFAINGRTDVYAVKRGNIRPALASELSGLTRFGSKM